MHYRLALLYNAKLSKIKRSKHISTIFCRCLQYYVDIVALTISCTQYLVLHNKKSLLWNGIPIHTPQVENNVQWDSTLLIVHSRVESHWTMYIVFHLINIPHNIGRSPKCYPGSTITTTIQVLIIKYTINNCKKTPYGCWSVIALCSGTITQWKSRSFTWGSSSSLLSVRGSMECLLINFLPCIQCVQIVYYFCDHGSD